MSIILASASPRREELLKLAGYKDFKICPANADETLDEGISPEQAVCALAKRKAESVARISSERDVIIAADTLVYLNGTPMGKPKNEDDAFKMLTALSGNTHTVYSGVCIIFNNKNGLCVSCAESTDVHFRQLETAEIKKYIQTGEPLDKAGAYAIQGKGCVFVTGIDGDYFNVMGLPVCRIYQILTSNGVFPSGVTGDFV